MAMVKVMVRGKPKEKFDFYIDPDDLKFIRNCIDRKWCASCAEFLTDAIRHYKDVFQAINEAVDEARAAHCAWLKNRIRGDGEKRDAAKSKPS